MASSPLEEAIAAGMSRHQLRHDIAAGRYAPIYKGVYVHAGAPRTLQVYEVAACKWAGRSALSNRSALQEYQLGGIKAERIELTTAEKRCHKARIIVHRTNYLPDSHIRIRNGRPVTDVARALFDSGAVVPKRLVSSMVGEAIRHKLTTRKVLLGRLVEHGGPGRRGCRALAEALVDRSPELDKSDSVLEEIMYRTVWSGDLPRPHVQYPLRIDGRNLRLDFAYPEIKFDIESDGRRTHEGDDAFENDRERDARLVAHGWVVARFTWKQLHEEPDWVVETIRTIHAERTQLFGRQVGQ